MKRLAGIFLLGVTLSSHAQSGREEVFFAQMSKVSEPSLLKDLPAHIKPVPGQLSLLADFQNRKGGAVTLYLINATEDNVILPKGDGDICCKREARARDGKWRRCDSHQYDWCLTGHSSVGVPAGGAISWQQKLDSKEGEARPVRFRMFNGTLNELQSNEGLGKVADEDITFCRYDAMAMKFGPLEDVAAVATGEVEGCQGASEDFDYSVEALERFTEEQRLFLVLQKTVDNLVRHSNLKDINPEDLRAVLRCMSAERNYQLCLRMLAQIMGQNVGKDEAWMYVAGQVYAPDFPWSPLALDWLVENFAEKQTSKKILVEHVLSKPEHLALQSALHAYGRLVEKEEASRRLEAISNDPRYSKDAREAARDAREKLFPNPYIRISFEERETIADKLQPLKTVTITNISPQTITLPVKKAEDLIFVRMVGNENGGSKMPAAGSGQLQLKPGQKIVLHDVAWWRGIDSAKISRSEKDPFETGSDSLNFILHAATPRLWTVPAEGSSIRVDRDKLLEALMKKP